MARKEFKLLDKGNYNVKVTGLTIAPSKNVKGCVMAKTEFTVVKGDREGDKVWDNYIIKHPTSTKAVEIGTEAVDKLLKATGNSGLGDLNGDYMELQDLILDKEITAFVYTQESNNPQYGDRNKASNFKKAF